jgi:hypothetical protein
MNSSSLRRERDVRGTRRNAAVGQQRLTQPICLHAASVE